MNVALCAEHANIISLCTGGGGLEIGLELAMPSTRSVCYVEREAFACANLVSAIREGFLDDAPIWSDVGSFDGRPWRGIVDGVVGGIPCQPHSLAGARLGEEDERDLWSDTRRSLNPLFVEWLMGWPPQWTLLASTDFACSATALSRYKLHMRSELLRLGLPSDGPPAQLALFG